AAEVLVGMRYSEAIEMWSLGCVALEMLSGKVLFPGCNINDMVPVTYFTV
ncbi:hypothetical protein NL108_003164, partial [Boleophthalmus pectinirostris]